MKITGLLSFGASNTILNTNNNLTLISNAAGTASVGDLTNNGAYSSNNIIGNVTVERFIPVHPKAWQFLSAPTRGQTINQSWQEGNAPLANNRPGYGTIITSPVANAVGLGFDVYTPSGSTMKTYNPATNSWVGVSNPANQIANAQGYMFFIRGDRSVTAFNVPATQTTMRTTGKLYTTGADAPPVTTVLAGKMESIGNPYPSSIDFRLITRPASPAIDDAFYVWDALLTNNYNGLGGYQTMSAANGWKPIPGGTTNYDINTAYPYIQSGQAFIVNATGAGGNISFTESSKVNEQSVVNRPMARIEDRQFLRLSLLNATGMLSDGNVVAFDNEFTNSLDANDAIKISNAGENIGIKRGNKVLALEARNLVADGDTIFYSFNNLRRQTYSFQFTPENITGGTSAILVDKYLNANTAISLVDTTVHNFSVSTDAGSFAADRFYLIFRAAPPAAITTISAIRNGEAVSINWTVENQSCVRQYQIERSNTTSNFTGILMVDPSAQDGGTMNYTGSDNAPLNMTSYYRIKGTRTNGEIFYSAIAKAVIGRVESRPLSRGGNDKTEGSINEESAISIYPNPVENKKINLLVKNHTAGVYKVQLINNLGQAVYNGKLEIADNLEEHAIQLGKTVAPGNYQLRIIDSKNKSAVIQAIIK